MNSPVKYREFKYLNKENYFKYVSKARYGSLEWRRERYLRYKEFGKMSDIIHWEDEWNNRL